MFVNKKTAKKVVLRRKRAFRVRNKLEGVRPRLCVFKSNKHIVAQIIDDAKGIVLCGISTSGKELRETEFNTKSKKSAKKIGERIAEIAKAKNVKEVVFDRGSFKYHGILAELAEAARAGGLQF